MIEQAVRIMRRHKEPKVFRCKKRYYCMIEDCLMRVFINDLNLPQILGVANLKGTDFITEDWEETKFKLVLDYKYE